MKKSILFIISALAVVFIAIFAGIAEAATGLTIATVGLTVDEQVADKLKDELKNLRGQIDAKIQKANEDILAEGNKEAKALTATMKSELEGLLKQHGDKFEEYTKRMDLLETKAGRFDQVMARKNFSAFFQDKLTEANVAKNYRSNGNVAITIKDTDLEGIQRKQDDMTATNTFTNNVPGYEHLPEIHFDPERKTRARDLILQGTTNMTAVEYVRESSETDNTGMTAQGAEFNQNDFDLTAYTANVRKITAYIMLAEEMLEDVAGMTSYIMAKLPGKINKVEDEQIIRGAGTGQYLSGLVTNATAYSDSLADSKVQRIDVLVDAVRQVVDDEYQPSFIVLHPADFYKIALTKDDNGQYILPWILGVMNPQLAGVPIVTSTAITEGDFLVHSREAAQVFFKKELLIEFSNQNEDNFVKGMVTVRAQKRLALAIYKPTAILTGDFTVALAQGTA